MQNVSGLAWIGVYIVFWFAFSMYNGISRLHSSAAVSADESYEEEYDDEEYEDESDDERVERLISCRDDVDEAMKGGGVKITIIDMLKLPCKASQLGRGGTAPQGTSDNV